MPSGARPFRSWIAYAALGLTGCLAACTTPAPDRAAYLERTGFTALAGWSDADPRPGLRAFLRSCEAWTQKPDDAPLGGAYAGTAGEWREVCAGGATALGSAQQARAFLETAFVPFRVVQSGPGLFTGYYEPVLRGSRMRHGPYQTPLYALPADLVSVDLGQFRDALKGQRIAGRLDGNRLVPYAPRSDIVRHGLGQTQALVYVDDPVDAFFLQIQGSGRIALDDGGQARAVYAGQNGHPYTAIGAVLIGEGAMAREYVSMQSIRDWLAAHPERRDEILDRNASYVFFAERPIGDPAQGAPGSQGVPLTPEASLAVDASIHALGVPAWVETDADAEPAFRALTVMQDTGGAIRGAVRGDIYWGVGDEAGARAGRMRSAGGLTVLLPQAVAARLDAKVLIAPGPP